MLTTLGLSKLGPTLGRLSLGAVMLAGAFVVPSAGQSSRVQNSCRGDAHRLCPQYKLGSSELRYCMESRGRQLSAGCIRALEDEGIISRGTASRARLNQNSTR